MTENVGEIVWEGSEAARAFLVPIDSLEPFPGNPNRGNVERIRESLRRFGQVRSIIVDGSRIVAGHHVRLAAIEEGFTHISAMTNEFENEEEQRAYLLADNRLASLGVIDDELLQAQLAELRDYEGTGYTEADAADLEARLAAIRGFRRMEEPDFDPTSEPPPALDQRSPTTGLFEVPLLLTVDDRKDFASLMSMHKREWALDDTTQVVLRLLRESGARL